MPRGIAGLAPRQESSERRCGETRAPAVVGQREAMVEGQVKGKKGTVVEGVEADRGEGKGERRHLPPVPGRGGAALASGGSGFYREATRVWQRWSDGRGGGGAVRGEGRGLVRRGGER